MALLPSWDFEASMSGSEDGSCFNSTPVDSSFSMDGFDMDIAAQNPLCCGDTLPMDTGDLDPLAWGGIPKPVLTRDASAPFPFDAPSPLEPAGPSHIPLPTRRQPLSSSPRQMKPYQPPALPQRAPTPATPTTPSRGLNPNLALTRPYGVAFETVEVYPGRHVPVVHNIKRGQARERYLTLSIEDVAGGRHRQEQRTLTFDLYRMNPNPSSDLGPIVREGLRGEKEADVRYRVNVTQCIQNSVFQLQQCYMLCLVCRETGQTIPFLFRWYIEPAREKHILPNTYAPDASSFPLVAKYPRRGGKRKRAKTEQGQDATSLSSTKLLQIKAIVFSATQGDTAKLEMLRQLLA